MIKVIVVDDEKVIREGIGRFISETQGFELLTVCENGAEAYEKIVEQHPDLVICDIIMPICDGIELIGRCREEGIDSEFLLLSGYSEFEYARAAIRYGVLDYINKPVNKKGFMDVLENSRRVIENKYRVKKRLKSNVYEKIMESEELAEDEKKVCRVRLAHRVLAVNLIFPEIDKGVQEKITEFCGFCERLLRKTAYEEYIVYERKGLILIILMGMDTKSHHIEKLCGDIQIHAKGRGDRAYAGVGDPIDDMQKIPESFRKAKAALYEAQCSGDHICFFEHLPYTYESPAKTYGADFSAVAGAIHVYDGEEVIKVVRSLTDTYRISAPPYVIYSFILKSANEILDAAEENSFGTGSEEGKIWLLGLVSSENIEILMERFEQFAEQMLKSPEVQKCYGGTIDEVLKFINLHYTGDISIEKICSVFYFNESYFSALFKTKTGSNYNDYITDLRIKRAKELLKTGRYKIHEIARMVGYNSSRYFSRVFKGKTGELPQEYKNRKLAELQR